MNYWMRLAAAAALSGASVMAHAAQVELQFTGTVSMTAMDSLMPGTAVSGRLSYDTSPTATDYFGSTFYHWTTPTSFSLDVGGRHISSMMLGAAILRGADEETLQLQSLSDKPEEDAPQDPRLLLAFTGPAGVFARGMPSSFNLADFSVHAGGMFLVGDVAPRFMFEVTSITAVPEPSAAWLYVGGVLAVAAAMRRRRVHVVCAQPTA